MHYERRERVVARVLSRLADEERVPLHFMPDAAPPVLAEQRRQEDLFRVLIADDRPVDAEHEANDEDVRGGKMREADVTHQEVIARLAGQGREGLGDEVSGYRQDRNRQGVHPVPEAHRRLIHIDGRLRVDA